MRADKFGTHSAGHGWPSFSRGHMQAALFVAVLNLIEFLIMHVKDEEQIVRDIRSAFDDHHQRQEANCGPK